MKLITKEIERKIERTPLYSQDGKGKAAPVICKFFTPDAAATWLVIEGEKQDNNDFLFFGIATLDGHFWEYGYFTLSELLKVRGRFGLPIERDLYAAGVVGDYIH